MNPLLRWMHLMMLTCTTFQTIGRTALFGLALTATVLFCGCAGGPDSTPSTAANDRPPVRNAALGSDGNATTRLGSQSDGSTTVSTYVDARPAALINGRQIQWGEMRPLLNEAAGGDVLEEIIVDTALARLTDEAGIYITESDTRRERDLLLRTLSEDPNVARRLLQQLRTRRGLGERRFEALLARNARLRLLVSSRVQVTEEQVRRLHEARYGPKRQARLMVLPDLSMAQQAIQRVRNGRSFADVAVEWSTDRSAARGGLLEPISRNDPRYPAALREELWSLQVGEISAPVLLDNGYAVIQSVRTLSAEEVPFDEVRSELEQAARLNQQRILMDQLVQRMLSDVSVTIFDESLRDAWKRRQERQP